MNLADTIRVLTRRWYITLPALVITMALAAAAFVLVKPTYERTATLLLLPDASSIPEGSNPYLYLSGLSPVADVLVRASSSQEFIEEVTGGVGTSEVAIGRDMGTTSPVLSVKTAAALDEDAARMMDATIEHVISTLADMQSSDGIPPENRISVQALTVDTIGTVAQRTRLMMTAAIAAVGLLLTVLIPALVEGLTRRRRRRPAEEDDARDLEPPPRSSEHRDDLTEIPPPQRADWRTDETEPDVPLDEVVLVGSMGASKKK